jgi:hypothetical protein
MKAPGFFLVLDRLNPFFIYFYTLAINDKAEKFNLFLVESVF